MKTFKTFTAYCNADEAVVIADVLADYQKQIKDLETANARLLERNHELQVDNEQSLKEVENHYKIVAALRNKITNQYNNAKIMNGLIEDLRNTNGDLARAGLNSSNSERTKSPKSKFVITVEEF